MVKQSMGMSGVLCYDCVYFAKSFHGSPSYILKVADGSSHYKEFAPLVVFSLHGLKQELYLKLFCKPRKDKSKYPAQEGNLIPAGAKDE